MGKRWVIFTLVVACLLSVFLAEAHKKPVIEYTYVSHIWEEAYETIPKQPVVNEVIEFRDLCRSPQRGDRRQRHRPYLSIQR